MAVNKVVYKHFEVKASPAAAHAVDALLFGCGKINNDLNPDYNADLVNSVAFRASECTITRIVRKNADDESTVLYDGTPVNHFYLEYEPEDENDNGLFSITVKKTDGTDAMKVVTVPYGTNRRPVYATQDEALRARMTQAEDDIDGLETRMTQAEEDIDALETKMADAEGDIDDNTQEINQLKARVSVLESLLTGAAGTHNSIYRGKNLGSSVTAEQYAAIAAGTFDDLYIGDYWTINGVVYRIAAFDYYLNSGDTSFTKHHAVIVPDTCLYNHVMNDTGDTTGAYVGSKMYTEGLEQAKSTIKAAFSGHVLSKRIYLSNATANGRASAGAWCDSEVDLMCEHMVYGNGVFSPVSDGTTVPNNYRVEKSQLPLFQHDPSRICSRVNWWLRDVISASRFAIVGYAGGASYYGASYSFGVRPAFCIGAV